MKTPHVLRGWAKPAMWHHYAHAHTGVCLMFEREALHRSFESNLAHAALLCGPVTYSDEGHIPKDWSEPFTVSLLHYTGGFDTALEARRHFAQWYRSLFLSKLNDWSHEREYRWLCFDSIPGICDVPFQDALRGLVLGSAIEDGQRSSIVRNCHANGIELGALFWRNGFPEIRPLWKPMDPSN